jgi:ankyrin repeat protein
VNFLLKQKRYTQLAFEESLELAVCNRSYEIIELFINDSNFSNSHRIKFIIGLPRDVISLFSYVCTIPDLKLMKFFLDKTSIEFNQVDLYGLNAFHHLCNSQNCSEQVLIDKIKLFLLYCDDQEVINPPDKITPLKYLFQNYRHNVIKFILENSDILSKFILSHQNLISSSISYDIQCSTLFKQLFSISILAKEFDPNIKKKLESRNETLLQYMCRKDYPVNLIKLLLDLPSIDMEMKDDEGNNLLQIAIKYLNLNVFYLLIEDGRVDINNFNNYRDTPIMMCAKFFEKYQFSIMFDILFHHRLLNLKPRYLVENQYGEYPEYREFHIAHWFMKTRKYFQVQKIINRQEWDCTLRNDQGETLFFILCKQIHSDLNISDTQLSLFDTLVKNKAMDLEELLVDSQNSNIYESHATYRLMYQPCEINQEFLNNYFTYCKNFLYFYCKNKRLQSLSIKSYLVNKTMKNNIALGSPLKLLSDDKKEEMDANDIPKNVLNYLNQQTSTYIFIILFLSSQEHSSKKTSKDHLAQEIASFFYITKQLPLELQMLIANYSVGINKQFVSQEWILALSSEFNH